MNIEKNNKNKIIKARVTEDEEILVKTKAQYYGYKNLSKYLIDAAIYEKVTYVDFKNQMEIYNAYAENTKELNEIKKEILHICKYATRISDQNVKGLKKLMFAILTNQKKMLSLIDKKMDLDVWQEINRNKDMEGV